MILEHEIEVTGDPAVDHQHAPGEGMHADEAARQLGRFGEIPLELVVPGGDFFLQHGVQIRGRDEPQIDDLIPGLRVQAGCHGGRLLIVLRTARRN